MDPKAGFGCLLLPASVPPTTKKKKKNITNNDKVSDGTEVVLYGVCTDDQTD